MTPWIKGALVALAMAGTTFAATEPAQARVHVGVVIGPGGYGPGYGYDPACNPRSRWYNPYRCDDGWYDDGYFDGGIFIDGIWFDSGHWRHRHRHGHHQFWHKGRWRDGDWGRRRHGHHRRHHRRHHHDW